MIGKSVADVIKGRFDDMPLQMQLAARFIVEHPKDVALLSMRELAKRAGVPASTMTRLAQRLGYPGYDELRAVYADDLRRTPDWFSCRAHGMLSRREEVGEVGLVGDLAATLSGYIRALADPEVIVRFGHAADVLMRAERIYCIGARSAYPVSYLFGYVQSYFWPRAHVLGNPGGADMDAVIEIGANDAVLAVSFEPYARSTLDAVRAASRAGGAIVSITDSEMVGIGRHSDVAILVPKHSPSFFDTLTPAFAAAEILSAVMASRIGPEVTRRVREREERLADMGIWISPGAGRQAAPAKGGARSQAASDRAAGTPGRQRRTSGAR